MSDYVESLIEKSLRELTSFQRATVAEVSERLLGKNGPHGRNLVGDEVGLGKTVVAKGVIATMLLHHLRCRKGKIPFKVVYICSNLALARENVRKLAIFDVKDDKPLVSTPDFGRLAELGLMQPSPESSVLLDMRSITPATSFMVTQGAGNARERYILWQALRKVPYVSDTRALEKFFIMDVGPSWENARDYFNSYPGLDPDVGSAFSERMGEIPDLDPKALQAAKSLSLGLRSWRTLLRDVSELSPGKARDHTHLLTQVRVGLRRRFVECCAANLQADLFILDEFQRFRDLVNLPDAASDDVGLEGQLSEQQIVAEQVLHKKNGYATLLLSATPFKALTHVKEDDEGKAHATELQGLLRYLCYSDPEVLEGYQISRVRHLDTLLNLPEGPLIPGSLQEDARRGVETILRRYICRTERAAVEPDIEHIFCNVDAPFQVPSHAEIAGFIALSQLADSLTSSTNGSIGMDVMRLYKSAPWCLSFLSGYQLREHLRNYRDRAEVKSALKQSAAAWLPYEKLQKYQLDLRKDVPCSRFKQVLDAAVPNGAEQLLWVPPGMPNYPGEGPFAGMDGFSKTLLFSSLVLTPRAMSGLVSYECERRIRAKRKSRSRYFDARKGDVHAMHFESKSISPLWSLIYPSQRLAVAAAKPEDASLKVLQARVRANLMPDVETLNRLFGKGVVGASTRWYCLAPMLLDQLDPGGEERVQAWLRAQKDIASAVGRQVQLARLSSLLKNANLELGPVPDDLPDYLVNLAIAGPGVCALRSLDTTWGLAVDEGENALIKRLMHASDVASSFVGKLNRGESQSILREVCRGDKPWVAVVRYSAMGNLQAVFDEYFHLLNSLHRTPESSVEGFKLAVDTGAVSVTAQKSLPPPQRTSHVDIRFHCHYAVPLGNQKSTDETGIGRITNARAAFNSPFWPFMLNSTSIGQEGLDFHWYCRRIVHWDLPGNPIDLEQREGRINRYKSLVVRQRVAETYASRLIGSSVIDRWQEVFRLAQRDANSIGLVPFWYCPSGSARIERLVPTMPFSRETKRLDEILRILSLYRLSFGQPRQQELLENLLRRQYSGSDLAEILRTLLINLAPVSYRGSEPTGGTFH